MPSNYVLVDPATNHIQGSGVLYDAAGNIVSDGVNNYVFDAESRLVSTSAVPGLVGGGSSSTLGYGPDGKLVNKNGTYYIIYANGQPIAEYANGAAAASPSVEYVNLSGRQIASVAGKAVTFNYADHLSTRVSADAAGNPVRTYGHFPYGETAYETGAASDFKFTSYRRDANSGLDYADARFYSSRLGRFISMDPLTGDNRYAYVSNDPINLVDPTGQDGECTTNPFDPRPLPLCGPDQLGGGGGSGGASCGINFDDGGFTVSFTSGCSSFSVNFSGGSTGPFGNVQDTLREILKLVVPIDTCPAGTFECPEDGAPLFGQLTCDPRWCVSDVQNTVWGPYSSGPCTARGTDRPLLLHDSLCNKGDTFVMTFSCDGVRKCCDKLYDAFRGDYLFNSHPDEFYFVSGPDYMQTGRSADWCQKPKPAPAPKPQPKKKAPGKKGPPRKKKG